MSLRQQVGQATRLTARWLRTISCAVAIVALLAAHAPVASAQTSNSKKKKPETSQPKKQSTKKSRTRKKAKAKKETQTVPSISIVEPISELPDLNLSLKRLNAPIPQCVPIVQDSEPFKPAVRDSKWIFQGVNVSIFNDNFPNFFGTPPGTHAPDNWLTGDDYGHTFGLEASVRVLIPEAARETDWLVITGVTTDNYSLNTYNTFQREDGRTVAEQRAYALTRIFVVARESKWDQTQAHTFKQFAVEGGIRNPGTSISGDANAIQEWFHDKLLTRATIPKAVALPGEKIVPFFSVLTGLGYFIPLEPSSASKFGDVGAIPQSAYATVQAGFKVNAIGDAVHPFGGSNIYTLGTISLPLGPNFTIEGANYVRLYAKESDGRTVAAVRGDASVTVTYSGLPVDLGLTYTRPYGNIDAEKALILNETSSSKMRFTIGVPLTPMYELINH